MNRVVKSTTHKQILTALLDKTIQDLSSDISGQFMKK